MAQLKPQLCCDFDESKLKFPLIAMPKIDGCRGINLEGNLTGRSLKPFKNKHVTAMFSKPEFTGIDGELAAGEWTNQSLCRDTTSAINRIVGTPGVVWWAFDYLPSHLLDKGYHERLVALETHVAGLNARGITNIKVVPSCIVGSLAEIDAVEAELLGMGFEGVILRDIHGKHKSGRATASVGSYLRIKRFTDAEAVVLSINEAMQNNNEQKVNELGRSERSSHQENMEAKGMVGSLVCKCCETGETITVGAGDMDHTERKYYFDNQSEIVGKAIKYKSFRHGVKDKPRFPTFLSIRAAEDMSS
jgi:hypothetical protein